METRLKFVRLLSLEKIALRRVSVLLCNNSDTMALFLETYSTETASTKFKDWQNAIEAKLSQLELPKLLEKQIIDYVPEIGLGVREWGKMHLIYFQMTVDDVCSTVLPKLCWTGAGEIDYRKTAERIVSCHLFNVQQRYDIASLYCFRNYIRPLWEDLPEGQKRLFRERPTARLLGFCWPHILKGELSELDSLWRESDRNLTSFHQWAFEKAASGLNQAASEYFFHHLTPGEREASLMRVVHSLLGSPEGYFPPQERCSVILCYLLSLMTPEQQMEIVRARPDDVLLCFLHWKRRDLFSENAALIWTFLPSSKYSRLLRLMDGLISSIDSYVPWYLHEFLRYCPLDFKNFFVNFELEGAFSFEPFLNRFFYFCDSESLRVVFTCLDAANRVKLVFSDQVFDYFYYSFMEEKWQLVEVCLREAALSEGDRERWKETFTRMFSRIIPSEEMCRQFFEFLDVTSGVKKSQKRASCSKE